MWRRCAYSCTQAHRRISLDSRNCKSDGSHLLVLVGVGDRQLGSDVQDGLVGYSLVSGLKHILAPGDPTLRRGGNECQFLSLKLESLQRGWSRLVWPRAGLVWRMRVDETACHRRTSRRPHVFWLLESLGKHNRISVWLCQHCRLVLR